MPRDEAAPIALVFDNFGDSIYRDLIRESADDAEWQTLEFDDPFEAAAALGSSAETIGALITTLGWRNGAAATAGSSFSSYPAKPIIAESNRLAVPRAVLSDHRKAFTYIRRGSRDIVIPIGRIVGVPGRITNWLTGLLEIGA